MAQLPSKWVSTEAGDVKLANKSGGLVGVGGGQMTQIDDKYRREDLDAPDGIEDYPQNFTLAGHPAPPPQPQPERAPSPVREPPPRESTAWGVAVPRQAKSRRASVTVDGQEVAVEETVQRQGLTTFTVSWKVVVDGVPRQISVTHGQLSGKRRIFIDGVSVHDSRKIWDDGSTHDFTLEGAGHSRKFTVAIIRDYSHYLYKLKIDDQDLENASGVVVDSAKSHQLTEEEALLHDESKTDESSLHRANDAQQPASSSSDINSNSDAIANASSAVVDAPAPASSDDAAPPAANPTP